MCNRRSESLRRLLSRLDPLFGERDNHFGANGDGGGCGSERDTGPQQPLHRRLGDAEAPGDMPLGMPAAVVGRHDTLS